MLARQTYIIRMPGVGERHKIDLVSQCPVLQRRLVGLAQRPKSDAHLRRERCEETTCASREFTEEALACRVLFCHILQRRVVIDFICLFSSLLLTGADEETDAF